MDVQTVVLIVLFLALIVLACVAVWGIREIVASVRSVRRLSDELDATLPGLIARADTTLAAVNAELVRVNGMVSQLEEVSDRVTNTTRAAQEIVEGPVAAVTGLADGARRFFSVLFR
jgi:uncharacterized protein YoxC